jgi:exopolysaccharide biosynthesis polyprenyl glycosylphosphotransferase
MSDSIALFVSWFAVATAAAPDSLFEIDLRVYRLAGVVIVGVALIAMAQLYRAAPAKVRSIELVRLSRVAVGTAIAAYLLGLVSRSQVRETVTGAVCCFLALMVSRSLYNAWLRAEWKRSHWLRPIVVVGNGAEAARIATLLDHHPELGFHVCGLVADGPLYSTPAGRDIPRLGPTSQARQIVQESGATFAVVTADGLSPREHNLLLRDLTSAGVHVQVSAGLSGISARRLRAMPVGHEPFLYIEPLSLGRPQMMAKRALDLFASAVVIVLSLPLMVVAAIAIKLEDGGPILFSQQRVGLNGRLITVYKLRTMVVDAESRLEQLMAHNERTGPLFKVARDPRTTRVGRILRASSIDELPQLFNVLNGTMSMVGPRPALPREVDQFDEELLGRLRVTPGVTGLWQVEARDDPSFESYRILDMLYVDNWSLSLDMAIMGATVVALVSRMVRLLVHSTDQDATLERNECERLGCHRVSSVGVVGVVPIEGASAGLSPVQDDPSDARLLLDDAG